MGTGPIGSRQQTFLEMMAGAPEWVRIKKSWGEYRGLERRGMIETRMAPHLQAKLTAQGRLASGIGRPA